jgi:putative folate metabolism gamma-glutamate ligase
MQITAIKTHTIQLGESLNNLLDKYIISSEPNKNNFPARSILAISSKIISICQSRVIPKQQIAKQQLIKQEADLIAQTTNTATHQKYGITLTIKNNILIPTAGIDESNGDDIYILYPENIQQTANLIWDYLRTKLNLNHLGIIITDSHTTPMRMGVTGICLGWCGFDPLYSYIGSQDLYNNPLKVTKINLLDALASSAVLMMGEGNEQTPIAIINNPPPTVKFLTRPPTTAELDSITIRMEDDLYEPLLNGVIWEK